MKHTSFRYVLGAFIVVIVILGALLLWPRPSDEKAALQTCLQSGGTFDMSSGTCAPSNGMQGAGSSASHPAGAKSAAGITYAPSSAANDVKVDSPIVNATVHNSSPIKVSGQARGSWFFEATFPAEVTDAKGNVIGHGRVQSQGDWMTDSLVPFTGSISYQNEPVGSHGYVLLIKDNPSGSPATAATVTIPVLFQ